MHLDKSVLTKKVFLGLYFYDVQFQLVILKNKNFSQLLAYLKRYELNGVQQHKMLLQDHLDDVVHSRVLPMLL